MAEDSDNALLPRGGSLPAPVLVDPLNALNRGLTTAGHLWEVEGARAKQAAGQAFLNSIDPNTGQPNQALLMQNLRNNPTSALAAQTAAQSGVTLDKDTYDLHSTRLSNMNRRMVELLTRYPGGPPQSAVNDAINDAVKTGDLPAQMADQVRGTFGDDTRQNAITITQGMFRNLTTQQQLDLKYGATQATGTGNATVYTPVKPGQTVVVPHSMTPAELDKTEDFPDLRKTLPNGQPNPDYGKKFPTTVREKLGALGYTFGPNGEVYPPGQSAQPGQGSGSTIPGNGRYGNVPPAGRGPGAAAAPPAAPAAPPAQGATLPAPQFGGPPPAPPPLPGSPAAPAAAAPPPAAGGGFGATLAPAAPGPQSFNVPPGASPVPSYVAAIEAGRQNALSAPSSGTMTAGPGAGPTPDPTATPSRFALTPAQPERPAEPGWGTGGTAPYSFGAPAARSAPAAPPSARAPLPSRPASQASPGEEEEMKGAGPRFQADTDAGAKAQAHQAVLGNMLSDVAQFVPGPDAQRITALRGRIQQINSLFGFNIPVDDKALAAGESFNKLAAQIADAQGAGSDKRLDVNTAANPHPGMSGPGIDFVVRQLQGNDDYIQAKAKLAQQYPNRSDYQGFLSTINNLDPRVFQYERLTQPQALAWFNALDAKAKQAFKANHKWAEDRGLVGGG